MRSSPEKTRGSPTRSWNIICRVLRATSCPASLEGVCVGIADRIDTITGCFSVGLIPSGSEDPYGLRRQSVAILNMLFERGLRLSLVDAHRRGLQGLRPQEAGRRQGRGRIRSISSVSGLPACSRPKGSAPMWWMPRCRWTSTIRSSRGRRCGRSTRCRTSEDYQPLVTALKRAGNILPKDFAGTVKKGLLKQDAEKALYEAFTEIKDRVKEKTAKLDFRGALADIASLRKPVDAFFDTVMVMDKDAEVKNNRLALLAGITGLFSRIADFSRLVAEHRRDNITDYRSQRDRSQPRRGYEPVLLISGSWLLNIRCIKNYSRRIGHMATGKKYIYFFGNGKADGTGTMKDLLGGKGAGLAEMTNAGVPVPPGFTITTEVCNLFYELGKRVPEGLDAEMREYMKKMEDALGGRFKFGDVEPAAARVRPLRLQVLHARHDGHGPEPGPERPDDPGPHPHDRQRALRLGRLPPVHPDVRQRGDGHREGRVRAHHPRGEEKEEGQPRYRSDGRGPEGARRQVQGQGEADHEARIPAGPLGAAHHGARCGLRFLEQPPRHHLPQAERHPRQPRHGRERPGHGLRQHGRHLGHRRGLHPRTLRPAPRSSTAST